ncbi:MAG: hypothetical protein ACI9FG_001999, partial [Crocinitomicaceae bacterium]
LTAKVAKVAKVLYDETFLPRIDTNMLNPSQHLSRFHPPFQHKGLNI